MSLIVSMAVGLGGLPAKTQCKPGRSGLRSPFRHNLASGRPAVAFTQRNWSNFRFARQSSMHAYPFDVASRHVSLLASLMICLSIILGSAAALTAIVPSS
ncbi:hypothetical protein FQV39_02220 [Bosea sp. F3-2]|uniref:hypothetical protein n=1 Tax=Bosea sp. F3-2 TaxID=2599640 RepID=UPI0011EE5362|nr:hypothetical protein [Bosea sp. F3-2]QEL21520.1 hypothetical protein FQV39_02220 [Bosea sp. F3-2]